MSSIIVNGSELSKELCATIQNKITQLTKSNNKVIKLVVIQIGNDPSSTWYARNIEKVGSKVGITVEYIQMDKNCEQDEVIQQIEKYNMSEEVNGIMLQLPLPSKFDKFKIINTISPCKDVDGVTNVNKGLLFSGNITQALVPATPLACMYILDKFNIDTTGKRVAIVGRGDTIGRPLIPLMIWRNATITVCHTKTLNLKEECRRAEIIIAAAGSAKLIKGDMISPGAIIIDVGFNELSNGSVVGDVDFETAQNETYLITPVPGGVGSLTTAFVLSNTLTAFERQTI